MALLLDKRVKSFIMTPSIKMKQLTISAYQLMIGFFLIISLTELIYRVVTAGVNP